MTKILFLSFSYSSCIILSVHVAIVGSPMFSLHDLLVIYNLADVKISLALL